MLYVCVLCSLPHGVVGLSVIVAFLSLTQLHFSVVGRYVFIFVKNERKYCMQTVRTQISVGSVLFEYVPQKIRHDYMASIS